MQSVYLVVFENFEFILATQTIIFDIQVFATFSIFCSKDLKNESCDNRSEGSYERISAGKYVFEYANESNWTMGANNIFGR